MGEYINKYANSAAIQSAVDGGELIKPYVALVDGVLDYNTISPEPDYTTMPLTFEITGDGDIKWFTFDSSNAKTIEYSKNGGEWTSITSSTGETLIQVVSGDTLQFRGDNAAYGGENVIINSFGGSTAQFKVKGNIMSLINSTNFSTLTTLESALTFYYLFLQSTGLTDASNLILPATTLVVNCYEGMFQGCESLTTAPELPATTLASGCYSSMFNGCTGLTTAPELPATTLVSDCYSNMFNGCRSLTTAPELPATTLADSCYEYMFNGCTSLNYIKCLATDISANGCTTNWVSGVAASGTFVKAASADWSSKTGNNGIPTGWTRVDA